MFTLMIGGAASGKSEYAEEYVLTLPGQRLYIATMQPFDEECRQRIARHRLTRRDKGFDTLECYTNLAGAKIPCSANILLECISNLMANEIYSPEGNGADAVLQGIQMILSHCARGNLTVVTNEVFSGGTDYEGDTLFYLRELARVNNVMAGWADVVIEVVCGLPNVLKGRISP